MGAAVQAHLHFIAQAVITREQGLTTGRKPVIRNHCRDRGKQTDSGSDQGFGNPRRHGRQRGLLYLRQTDERVHDPPYGAEQADIGADRTDRSKELQALFQAHFLLADRDIKSPFNPLHHPVGIDTRLLLELRIFTVSRRKHLLGACVFMGQVTALAVQGIELTLAPKALSEGVNVPLTATQNCTAAHNQKPAQQ